VIPQELLQEASREKTLVEAQAFLRSKGFNSPIRVVTYKQYTVRFLQYNWDTMIISSIGVNGKEYLSLDSWQSAILDRILEDAHAHGFLTITEE